MCWGFLGEEGKCHMLAGLPDYTARVGPLEVSMGTRKPKAFASSYFLWVLGPTLSLPLKAPNLCRCGGSGRGAWRGRPQEAHAAQLAVRCCGLCAWQICWH